MVITRHQEPGKPEPQDEVEGFGFSWGRRVRSERQLTDMRLTAPFMVGHGRNPQRFIKEQWRTPIHHISE
ncbi:jg27457, partial [Pararge aegeria aegeria]